MMFSCWLNPSGRSSVSAGAALSAEPYGRLIAPQGRNSYVGEPIFLNGFATVDRFDLLFLFNPLDEEIELSLPDGNVTPELPFGV